MDAALDAAHGGRLPATRELTAQYLLLFDTSDPETLAPVLSEPSGKVQVLIRLAHAASTRERAFVARLQAALPTLAPAPISARVTGTGLLRLETNDEFTDGLARHLLLASVAMAVLLGFAFRSWRFGTLALAPNLFPILFLYGILGWLRIPLNAATVTTGAAALGDAVDDTVQYLDRYRRLLRKTRSGEEARLRTLEGVGIPMIASDVGLAAGFCVFLLSRFFPVTSLGLLGAAAMLLSLLANLFVLPVLMALTELRPLRRLLVRYVNQARRA
jgi:predicted RND superfamily exporter protein